MGRRNGFRNLGFLTGRAFRCATRVSAHPTFPVRLWIRLHVGSASPAQPERILDRIRALLIGAAGLLRPARRVQGACRGTATPRPDTPPPARIGEQRYGCALDQTQPPYLLRGFHEGLRMPSRNCGCMCANSGAMSSISIGRRSLGIPVQIPMRDSRQVPCPVRGADWLRVVILRGPRSGPVLGAKVRHLRPRARGASATSPTIPQARLLPLAGEGRGEGRAATRIASLSGESCLAGGHPGQTFPTRRRQAICGAVALHNPEPRRCR
jgi:hypothetical protein